MYVTSAFVAGGQYYVADTYGMTLLTPAGKSVNEEIDKLIGLDRYNEEAQKIVTAKTTSKDAEGNPFDCILAFNSCMAGVVWDTATILSGVYIFNFLILFGMPFYFVGIIGFAYSIFLFRTIAGMLRGF